MCLLLGFIVLCNKWGFGPWNFKQQKYFSVASLVHANTLLLVAISSGNLLQQRHCCPRLYLQVRIKYNQSCTFSILPDLSQPTFRGQINNKIGSYFAIHSLFWLNYFIGTLAVINCMKYKNMYFMALTSLNDAWQERIISSTNFYCLIRRSSWNSQILFIVFFWLATLRYLPNPFTTRMKKKWAIGSP